MRSTLEKVRDRSKALLALNYLAGQTLYRLGLRPHQSGATHHKYTVAQGAEYVQRVFDDYLTVTGVAPSWLAGKKVLEIGPGDNLGVALLFRAHGAEVHCLDRFAPFRDVQKNRDVYRHVAEASHSAVGTALMQLLSASGEPRDGSIAINNELAIEDAALVFPPGTFDLIVSRAVLEHVSDLEAAWASMHALLRPGGISAHKVDFRNHGFYDSLHPLAFLTQAEWLWRLVSSPDPTLNRKRAGTYEDLCRRFGYQSTIVVTHWSLVPTELPLGSVRWPVAQQDVPSVAELVRIRPGLSPKFRQLPVEDLGVAGIFLAAKKDAGVVCEHD